MRLSLAYSPCPNDTYIFHALATGLGDALDRNWDEAALSARFSRGWDAVAADTLAACVEACAHHAGTEPIDHRAGETDRG